MSLSSRYLSFRLSTKQTNNWFRCIISPVFAHFLYIYTLPRSTVTKLFQSAKYNKRCTQNIFVPFDRLASFLHFHLFFFLLLLLTNTRVINTVLLDKMLKIIFFSYTYQCQSNEPETLLIRRCVLYCQKCMLSFVESSIDYSRGGRYFREIHAGTHRYLHARFLARISWFIKKLTM